MTGINGTKALWSPEIASAFDPDAEVVIAPGDCLATLRTLPDGLAKLVITSPPYNLGKVYEKVAELEQYLTALAPIVDELVRVLAPEGSLCWQVGNYVEEGEVFPLDIFYYPFFKSRGLKLRNRIIWHFEHGLHATKRFSGRYETLLWFTKGDSYTFNLDPVRVPSKYPGKTHFKGEKYGQPSGNPLGKNPADFWKIVERDWEAALWEIPNVKANHPEKTIHPCQFPIELVERCVLALTNEDDWVLDPFSGVGSALLAALRHKRRAFGCEKEEEFVTLARQRVEDLYTGRLRYRPLGKPVHQPTGREKVSQIPLEWLSKGD
ncbi:MAG: site-specific DNA-methyltransferase [Acidobacteria bacterium]|nr:site-specific DNA-methyltransferase [Acidobacteriota bacterium]MBI3421371.1 site-specific DNA-methyltransferase [Acidobacteriota bacterium]